MSSAVKNLQLIVLALSLVAVASTDLSAQQFGRGRFLKKLRDDIFGTSNKPETEKKSKPKTSQSKSNNSRQPTPAGTGVKKSNSKTVQYQNSRSQSSRSSRTKNDTKSFSYSDNLKRGSGKGFGLEVVEKDEKLFISRVVSGGNADEAGLKRGDQIVELGGLKTNSRQEYDEISKIMGQGDQLGIKIRRKGRTDEKIVQYGTAPELPEPKESTVKNDLGPAPSDEATDFSPPIRSSDGMDSVLDQKRKTPWSALPSSPVSAARYSMNDVQELVRTVSAQKQQIQRMEQEIIQLRQALKTRR